MGKQGEFIFHIPKWIDYFSIKPAQSVPIITNRFFQRLMPGTAVINILSAKLFFFDFFVEIILSVEKSFFIEK